jgi:cell division ATPase FtsA
MFAESMRAGKSRRVAAINFEEDRLILAVGRARDRRLEKLDFIEEHPSHGLRGGMVADNVRFADALDKVSETLEHVSRSSRIARIVCGIHGPFVSVECADDTVQLGASHPLSDDRLRRLLYETAHSQAEGRVLLQVVPWRYLIDEYREIDRPTGLRADKLKVEVLGVYAQTRPFADFQDVLRETGLEGAELALTSLASARVALTAEERTRGVAMLEFAWEECRISVYKQGRLCLYDTAEMGLSVLADELARHEPMTASDARRRIPQLNLNRESDDDPLIAATREYLERVLRQARKYLDENLSVSGWVLTGAVADATGVAAFAEQELGAPVRIGRPRDPFRIAGYEGSHLTSVIGLLDCAASDSGVGSPRVADRFSDIPRRWWDRIREWSRPAGSLSGRAE